jgi:formylglycine-generating enzyme required for sulfatase activity
MIEDQSVITYQENLGKGIILEMVAIPSGKFMMGSNDRYDDEQPIHEVTVSSFYMGKYPVTQEQWKAIALLDKIDIDLDPNRSYFKGDKKPVDSVSWNTGVEFCKRLSKLTGKDYRLPSEAEWEYACRAGSTTPFYCGETITTELANYDGYEVYANGPKGSYREQTTSVGQFPPNPRGLYDMHGNVWEWCADTWHDNYTGAPTDGSAWLNNENDNNSRSILRGGSWCNNPDYCRSACRNYFGRDLICRDVGFRVVCCAGRAL